MTVTNLDILLNACRLGVSRFMTRRRRMPDKKTQTRPLAAVARSSTKLAQAEAEYVRAVTAAQESGESLRAIADAAQTSHERIRNIIRRGSVR
jgi:hypothetical protein